MTRTTLWNPLARDAHHGTMPTPYQVHVSPTHGYPYVEVRSQHNATASYGLIKAAVAVLETLGLNDRDTAPWKTEAREALRHARNALDHMPPIHRPRDTE